MINSRLDIAKQRVSEFKNIVMQTFQTEAQKEKKIGVGELNQTLVIYQMLSSCL